MPTLPEPVGDDDASERAFRWCTLAAGAAALLVVVVLALKAATWDWLAVGDFGVMRLRTLDVGTSHTPLVGVYSRWGWNHPGPFIYYAYAPFVRAVGGGGHGLLLGALAVSVASVAATLVVAARAGRRFLTLTGLVLALFLVGLDPAGLINPWNPYVLILPLFAAAVAAWRTAFDDRFAAVVLVVAGSFALQSHLLAGPPVLGLLAVGAVGLGLRAVRGPERNHARLTAALAVGVGLVCWIPPVVQQLTGTDGNLAAIFDFALHNDEPRSGWGVGARVVGSALSLPPTWITGALSRESHPIPWALFALGAATAWAVRRRWTNEVVLCVVAWVLVLAAFVGSAQVTGIAFPYLFRWVWAVAAVVWMAVGAVALAELRSRWTGARFAPAAMAAATAVVLVGLVVSAPGYSELEGSDRPLRDVSSVLDPAMAALAAAPGPVLLTPTDFGIDTAVGLELLARADEAGLDVGFPSDQAFALGGHRTLDPATARSEMVLAAGDAIDRLAADPRFRLVAEYVPLTPEEQAELDRLGAVDWGSSPSGPEYDRYRELTDRAYERISLYLTTPDRPG